jgi:hypothetical protein
MELPMTVSATQSTAVTPIQTIEPLPATPLTLTQRIDADEGLKSKRKLLTVVSLILLAIAFSGAKVVEANTFIMKISFTNQNGIAYLLLLSILFLMIRYFNYARPYHDELYKLWTERMLNNHYFYSRHPFEDEVAGLIMSKIPDAINIEAIRYEGGSFNFEYSCSWLFVRKFTYSWADSKEADYEMKSIRVGWENYIYVLALEAKYQVSSFFTHRENLDILAPYLLGAFSIISFIYNKQIIEILKGFTV